MNERRAVWRLQGGHRMANKKHLDILKQGVEVWNQWRKEHPGIRPNLSGIFLSSADLSGANLTEADLRNAQLKEIILNGANLYRARISDASLIAAQLWGADLTEADLALSRLNRADLRGAFFGYARLTQADLSEADLRETSLHGARLDEAKLNGANLSGANLNVADLTHAKLKGANLSDATLISTTLKHAYLVGAIFINADLNGADLSFAILDKANLSGASLIRATLVETMLRDATLDQCIIYGISAWNVKLEGAKQNNLRITPFGESAITVDNLKIAQFIHLLLNNAEIREVIDTIARKAVLILGRFTPERKVVLDGLREALRTYGYVPILFDFDKPASRDLTGTISTLAHLARFIIVDLTDPSSTPHEVATVIPQTVVPVQPVLLDGEREYSMFRDLRQRYHWVLPTYSYTDQAHLLAMLQEHVIAPAEQKAQELEKR
jgi:uncharacterized protein YjbI with pentapeptide repeats